MEDEYEIGGEDKKDEKSDEKDEKIKLLQTLIEQKERQLDVIKYQTDYNQNQNISLPKPKFYLLVSGIICLVFISIYSFFFNIKENSSYETSFLNDQTYEEDYYNYDSLSSDNINTPSLLNTLTTEKKSHQKPFNFRKKPIQKKPPSTLLVKQNTIKSSNSLFKKNNKSESRYRMARSRANIYKRPNVNKLDNKYLFDRGKSTRLTAIRERNGFIYVAFPNNEGGITRGWLRKRDLRKVN